MPRLRILESARDDLADILEYIAVETGNRRVARRFVTKLRQRCAALAQKPVTLGTSRRELGVDIRSFAVGRHLIFFRYAGDVFEVVNIIEGHRDLTRLFSPEDGTG